jgi:hypothetical protein
MKGFRPQIAREFVSDNLIPSPADDCWRLSADCSHWAAESRDNAARLAFRQMALAWAGLAFTQDFLSPNDQELDPTSSETEPVASAENTAPSQTPNEGIVLFSNAEVDARGLERTGHASTRNSPDQSPITLPPINEPADPADWKSPKATPAENAASSRRENEIIAPVSSPADAGSHEQRTGAGTNKSSGHRERLSLRSPTPFPKR